MRGGQQPRQPNFGAGDDRIHEMVLFAHAYDVVV
jgi:hypothetical protein